MNEATQPMIDCLVRSYFGKELDRAQLATLAGYMRQLLIPAGESIIREGDKDHRLFVVARGALEASRPMSQESLALVRVGPGGIVGEVGFLEGLARTATVRATVETEVHTLERADFERLLDAEPRIACGVLRALLRSVHGVVARLTERNVDLIGYIYS